MQTKGKWRPAKVISVRQETPRSYDIITPDGQTYQRNRSHLKKVNEKSVDEPDIDDDELSTEEILQETIMMSYKQPQKWKRMSSQQQCQ